MSESGVDPRCARSRRDLQRAFMDLVCERGFDAVSVALVAERAGVNRSTFYSHYRDKHELLRVCMVEWLERFAAELADLEPGEIRAALPVFVQSVLDHHLADRAFFLRILEDGRFPAYYGLFTQWITENFRRLIARLVSEGEGEEQETLAVFLSSAFFGAMLHWLRRGDASGSASYAQSLAGYALTVLDPERASR